MIRGINRQIIEVNDTENDYFERALFFVSPDYCDAERAVLEHDCLSGDLPFGGNGGAAGILSG